MIYYVNGSRINMNLHVLLKSYWDILGLLSRFLSKLILRRVFDHTCAIWQIAKMRSRKFPGKVQCRIHWKPLESHWKVHESHHKNGNHLEISGMFHCPYQACNLSWLPVIYKDIYKVPYGNQPSIFVPFWIGVVITTEVWITCFLAPNCWICWIKYPLVMSK